MSRPGQRSKPIEEEKLDELLEEILTQAIGKKIDKSEMYQIIGIAKEMLQKVKPGGVTKADVYEQRPEFRDLMKNTLTAATSVAILMTGQKNKITDLLDAHKQMMLELKGLKPSPENDAKRKELTQQINGIKKELQNTLKFANRFDSNPDRKEAMDKVLDTHDLFKPLEDKEDLTAKASPSDNKELENTLSESLRNLYGMDPRVPGSIASPVFSLIGNEYGIADNAPTLGTSSMGEGLKVLENEVASAAVENKAHGAPELNDIMDTLEDLADDAIDSTLENNRDMGYEPPSLTAY